MIIKSFNLDLALAPKKKDWYYNSIVQLFHSYRAMQMLNTIQPNIFDDFNNQNKI